MGFIEKRNSFIEIAGMVAFSALSLHNTYPNDTKNTKKFGYLNAVPYQPIWERMQQFTHTRDAETADELWLLEHDPVFTQGKAENQSIF